MNRSVSLVDTRMKTSLQHKGTYNPSTKVAGRYDTADVRVESVPSQAPPLIVHIINRLAIGGLENGLVNLINHMPPDRYRHAIVCLTDFTDFRDRLAKSNIPVVALHKRARHDPGCYVRMWKTLRTLRPAIVHTRNLPTMEHALIAAAAGVSRRIHGEHGRDMYDLDGTNFKYRLLRKALAPSIAHFTAVSKDLSSWLVDTVGVGRDRVSHIYNGVDVERFRPRTGPRKPVGPEGFVRHEHIVIGWVGRMQAVKDPLTLVRAFIHLLDRRPDWRDVIRLVMVGGGPLREEAQWLLRGAGVDDLAWLPGEHAEIPKLMRSMDLFVLPSRAEGISNTVLEAMASGLPVVATRVGGNPELVVDGATGALVPPAEPEAIADVVAAYVQQRDHLTMHGRAARARAETCFSMTAMVNGYLAVYDRVLAERPVASSFALRD